jgi:hypothetical protein
VAGERTLDAAACFSGGLAGSEEPLVVGGGLRVVADPLQGDDVEGPVELAVAAAVEAVPSLLAAGGIDWARAGERGEGGLASHAAGVAAGDEQLGGADGPHAALLEQIGRDLGDERGESPLGLREFLRQSLDAPAEPPQDADYDLGMRSQPRRLPRDDL